MAVMVRGMWGRGYSLESMSPINCVIFHPLPLLTPWLKSGLNFKDEIRIGDKGWLRRWRGGLRVARRLGHLNSIPILNEQPDPPD